jgi:hypothetical protein
MKVVSLIPSYKPNEHKVSKVVSELKRFSDRVIVFTASDHFYDGCEVIKFDPSIQCNLVFEPRKWVVNNIGGDWDYVLYNEDDIVITKESFDNAVALQPTLPYPYVIGFNRFEMVEGVKYWIDQHPDHGVHTGNPGKNFTVKNESDWMPANFHSGNFLLPKLYADTLIRTGQFDTRYGEHGKTYCGILESGATSLYRTLNKVLPLDFERVECEHLDNKYWHHPHTPTTETLKKLLLNE